MLPDFKYFLYKTAWIKAAFYAIDFDNLLKFN